MCGIFGIGFVKGTTVTDKNDIINLIKELGERAAFLGSTSSGIAIANPFKVTMAKYKTNMNDFLRNKDIVNMISSCLEPNMVSETNTYAVIGHCRNPTKGSENINENNHPIRVEDIVGIHTGHVNNDDALFKKHNQLKRIGQVDSEAIFQLINMYRKEEKHIDINRKESAMVTAIRKTYNELEGSVTCAVLSKEDKYKLYLFKRHSQLDARFYTQLGIVVFSSNYNSITRPSMLKVFEQDKLENISLELEQEAGLAINLRSSSFYKFSLKREQEASRTDRALYSGMTE